MNLLRGRKVWVAEEMQGRRTLGKRNVRIRDYLRKNCGYGWQSTLHSHSSFIHSFLSFLPFSLIFHLRLTLTSYTKSPFHNRDSDLPVILSRFNNVTRSNSPRQAAGTSKPSTHNIGNSVCQPCIFSPFVDGAEHVTSRNLAAFGRYTEAMQWTGRPSLLPLGP